MYAHNLTEEGIKSRIVEEVDTERFRQITDSTLEGLAKRELNLSAIVGKSAEAKERRLVPEVIEDFFIQAGPVVGLLPKERPATAATSTASAACRATSGPSATRLEPRFGKLGKEYKQIVFDKALLAKDATSRMGHARPSACSRPSARRLWEQVRDDLTRGAVFFDLHSAQPYHLDVFSASVKDGLGNELHRRLFVVQSSDDGRMAVKQPTIFLDLAIAPKGTAIARRGRLAVDRTSASTPSSKSA